MKETTRESKLTPNERIALGTLILFALLSLLAIPTAISLLKSLF